MFTAKIDNRSLYGYIEKFVRVTIKGRYSDIAIVRWLPLPEYPDGDELYVHIRDLRGVPANGPRILLLDQFDPARILYELDGTSMNPMRVEGLDKMP